VNCELRRRHNEDNV